jgi:hypothetical protein
MKNIMRSVRKIEWLAVLVATGLSGAADGQLIITEVDLAGNKVELVNVGVANVDATIWWWCNRVNGSPSFYATVASASTIDAALSTATSLDVGPGEILVVTLTSGFLPDANGELGLYNSNSFGSSGAIEDYVLWGANGIRDFTAALAGIWIDNDSIDVSGIAVGETIQLGGGLPGNEASEYSIGPSGLGVAPVDPVQFLQIDVTGGTVGLCFQSISGTVYNLQSTPDLVNTTLWLNVGSSIIGDGSTNYFFDAAGSTQKLYRILWSP